MALRVAMVVLTTACCSMSLSAEHLRCGRGRVQVENSCFILSTEKGNWNQAWNICHSRGQHLARINTMRKHRGIAHLMAHAKICCEGIWTDVKQSKENASTFHHATDGSQVLGHFWNSGEPNDANEKCVEYREGGGRFGWNDQHCDLESIFICEAEECPAGCKETKTQAQYPVDAQRCQNGDMRLGSTCYYIETMREALWHHARQRCEMKSGKLARVNDEEKNKDLDAYLLSLPGWRFDTYWISARRERGNEFGFPGRNEHVPGSNWGPGKPNNTNGQQACTSYSQHNSQFVRTVVPCHLFMKFICEITECPEDCRQKTPSTMPAMITPTTITTGTRISSYSIQTPTRNVTVTTPSAAVDNGEEETATTTQTPSSTTDSHADSACSLLQVLVTMITSLYVVTLVCIDT